MLPSLPSSAALLQVYDQYGAPFLVGRSGMLQGNALRYRATQTAGHPHAALINFLTHPMTQLGYDPDCTDLGWDIPDKAKGIKQQDGKLMFWMAHYNAFNQKWMAASADMPPEIQREMMLLHRQVITWMAGPLNETYKWMMAAHRLLARFDAFLLTGLLTSLTAPTSQEEDTARLRVEGLGYDKKNGKPPKAGPSGSSASSGPSRSSHNGPNKRRRRNNSTFSSGGGGGRAETGEEVPPTAPTMGAAPLLASSSPHHERHDPH